MAVIKKSLVNSSASSKTTKSATKAGAPIETSKLVATRMVPTKKALVPTKKAMVPTKKALVPTKKGLISTRSVM